MARQPFSYYGGKQKLIKKILPYVPKHTVFCEPFCGGATLFWSKPWPDINSTSDYREILNDKDELIYNFYQQMKDRFDDLFWLIQHTTYHEKEHARAKYICRNPEWFSSLDKAWAFYVNINQSFANVINKGWGRGVYGGNPSARFHSKLIAFNEFRSRLDGVHLTNQDALTVIEQWDSPQTFFYCDPPYIDTDNGNYIKYTKQDYIDLIEVLSNIKGSMILSSYNNRISKPDDWKKVVFKTTMSASGTWGKARDTTKKNIRKNLERNEVLYIKQASIPREEILGLYDSGKFDCFDNVESLLYGDSIESLLYGN